MAPAPPDRPYMQTNIKSGGGKIHPENSVKQVEDAVLHNPLPHLFNLRGEILSTLCSLREADIEEDETTITLAEGNKPKDQKKGKAKNQQDAKRVPVRQNMRPLAIGVEPHDNGIYTGNSVWLRKGSSRKHTMKKRPHNVCRLVQPCPTKRGGNNWLCIIRTPDAKLETGAETEQGRSDQNTNARKLSERKGLDCPWNARPKWEN